MGWRGASKKKRPRTTIANPANPRAADLVDRQFYAGAPNRLWVADLTYVAVTAGFEFDVPVRFDTDVLDVTLDLERLGSITSIPLLELRR